MGVSIAQVVYHERAPKGRVEWKLLNELRTELMTAV